jgi:hypothetical protein
MANPRITSAIIIPMLLIGIGGYVYSHWTDSVSKIYRLHFGNDTYPLPGGGVWGDPTIESYKVLTEAQYDVGIVVYPDSTELESMGGTSTLQISATITAPGWYIWVGLVIHNQGAQPVLIGAPAYQFSNGSDISNWFAHQEYLYGPFTQGEFATVDPPVWEDIEYYQLPPNHIQATPPVALAYSQELVLWIRLQLRQDYPDPTNFILSITIAPTATPFLP